MGNVSLIFFINTFKKAKMYFDIEDNQLPIIYRKEYNVHFCGMEKLHPFDARKWGHVFKVPNFGILNLGH